MAKKVIKRSEVTKAQWRAHRKKKKIRQNEERRLRNKARKTRIKNLIKKFNHAVLTKHVDEAERLLRLTYKVIDKVAAKNTIHKNKASRLKSKLAKKLNELKVKVES